MILLRLRHCRLLQMFNIFCIFLVGIHQCINYADENANLCPFIQKYRLFMMNSTAAELIYRLGISSGQSAIALDRYIMRPDYLVQEIAVTEKHLLSYRAEDDFEYYTFDPITDLYYYYNKEKKSGPLSCAYLARTKYDIDKSIKSSSFVHKDCLDDTVCVVKEEVRTFIKLLILTV